MTNENCRCLWSGRYGRILCDSCGGLLDKSAKEEKKENTK